MKTEVMTITPEMAKDMLKGNQRNRPVKKEHILPMAESMKEGKWMLNGVPIIFNGKLLIDGQHRLMACVKSGVSFKSLVVSDVEADSFITIDTGRKRTAADTLATKGEKNYNVLAAGAVIVDIYFNGNTSAKTRMSARGAWNTRVLEVLKTYPALRQSVDYCQSRYTKIVALSIMVATHYIFGRIDQHLADIFIDRLATGNNVPADSAMSILRSRLIDNYASPKKYSRGYVISLIVKAWNAERTGRNVKQLRGWTGEDAEAFPIAI